MSYFKKELIPELFYEMLSEYIDENLRQYQPISKYYPIKEREDLEVDYRLNLNTQKPIFLFGVKDSYKARLTTISCLEFMRHKLPFKSVIVHQNFDGLSKKDRLRLTSAADKQFTDFDDFKENATEYFEREAS